MIFIAHTTIILQNSFVERNFVNEQYIVLYTEHRNFDTDVCSLLCETWKPCQHKGGNLDSKPDMT